ncbi:MAG: NifU N-terminal domain-containing protein [Planctomycetes bacterium]|nr:NifU N-terminal domain-containing protein [Planctomycetota bacterium]
MVQVQSIQPTPNPNEFKFVCDGPLSAAPRRYGSPAEATGNPLAERILAIDGVVGLVLDGRAATVQMSNDADWRAVHEASTRAIEGAPALPAGPVAGGVAVAGAARVERIESTPNPNAFKLICDARLFDGTRNYTRAADAKGHELAEKLFAIARVDTVFFCDHFVTVSMQPGADLDGARQAARVAIESTAAPLGRIAASHATAADRGFEPSALDPERQDLFRRINELLDDRVRPALANDGGGLEVVGLEGKTLLIRYQGACGSCPSSIAGTLMAIQNLLQVEIDEELSVVSS